MLEKLTKVFTTRQPHKRLPWLAAKRGGRSAKKTELKFLSYRLRISLRKFETQAASRSRKQRQLVMGAPFLLFIFGYREIAFTLSRRRVKKLGFQPLLSPQFGTTLLIIIGLASGAYFGAHLNTYSHIEPSTKTLVSSKVEAAAIPKPYVLPASQPTELIIPKINLDASLANVDLNQDGSLQVPNDPWIAGWYDRSPSPGQLGPAIIDGHLDYIDNIAVFWNLRQLGLGDNIQVKRADSTIASFTVDQVQEYSQSNFPTATVYGNTNYAALRLITCGGQFDPATRHYDENLVIFAHLVQ